MTTWAIADLHGHLEIWKKVKEIIGPDDIVYVLGDCVDRGPQSWETLKTVYNDPQARLLKGNHEDMLVKACEDYLEYGTWEYHSYSLCRMNGGEDTMLSWERDPDREMWLKRLRALPTWDSKEIDGKYYTFCHAGFTPWFREGTMECFVPADRMLIWDREHYFEDWVDGEMDDDIVVVHGHTPIHHLSEDLWVEWESGAFWYCDDHKVCIDSGGFFSGEFILLCLDTREDIVLTLD